MEIEIDKTKHCRTSGITLHKTSYRKHMKSEKHLLITGKKCRICTKNNQNS